MANVLQSMAGRVARRVVDDPVGMGVLAGEDRRSAGRTERRRGERVEESRAVARELVDRRRLDERMTGDADVVPSQIVNKDDDDVGRPASSHASTPHAVRSNARSQRPEARRPDGHDSRFTIHDSRFTIHDSRFTIPIHDSRFTIHRHRSIRCSISSSPISAQNATSSSRLAPLHCRSSSVSVKGTSSRSVASTL